MVTRDFAIKLDDVNKRLTTIVQHKLRLLMSCYTVYDFVYNEQTKVFTFKKTHAKRNHKVKSTIQYKDHKEFSGTYNVVKLDEDEYKLELTVFNHGKGNESSWKRRSKHNK